LYTYVVGFFSDFDGHCFSVELAKTLSTKSSEKLDVIDDVRDFDDLIRFLLFIDFKSFSNGSLESIMIEYFILCETLEEVLI
jgi:hypothetical protein